jgi:hypothetical protein
LLFRQSRKVVMTRPESLFSQIVSCTYGHDTLIRKHWLRTWESRICSGMPSAGHLAELD